MDMGRGFQAYASTRCRVRGEPIAACRNSNVYFFGPPDQPVVNRMRPSKEVFKHSLVGTNGVKNATFSVLQDEF
jgi:hypothetical protein